MKSISQLLSQAPVSRLEAEVLLAHALKVERSFLYSHANDVIDEALVRPLYERRVKGEPVAYILGFKEFWKSTFVVNPQVLIPRPETELLVEKALSLFAEDQVVKVADLGTGSGVIALSLAQERPAWNIVATDVSEHALVVAKQNQVNLKIANVNFYQGSWCEALPNETFELIISNPPYIASHDPHLKQGDLRFEPKSALVAAKAGLADIQLIAEQAKDYLKSSGFLLIEHGYHQSNAVSDILREQGYEHIHCFQDLAGLDRVTLASCSRWSERTLCF